MKYFYDPNHRIPYLFISDIEKDQVREINLKLKEKGISPEKVYDPPSYPAGDGILYQYMIRMSFVEGRNPNAEIVKLVLQEVFEKSKDLHSASGEYEPKLNLLVLELDKTIGKYTEKVINTISQKNAETKNSIDAFDDRLLIVDERIKSDVESLHNQINVLSKGLKQALELLGELSTRGTDSDMLLDQIEQLSDSIDQREKERKVMEHWHVTALSKLIEDKKHVDKTEIIAQKETFGTVIPELKHFPNPRILILGNSEIPQERIMTIVIDEFKSIDIRLTKDDLTVQTTLQFQKPSGSYENEVKKDYDYLIYGPMPHSVKGKSGLQSWENYCSNKGLKTKVYPSNSKNLNKSMLENFLHLICEEELLKRK